MTYSEIIPGNQLIAGFLGAAGPDLYWLPQLKDEYTKQDQFSPSELKFHIDWNWLMKAIEKIEPMIYDNYEIVIGYKSCIISGLAGGFSINKVDSTKIKATWKAIVCYIMWLNSQNQ